MTNQKNKFKFFNDSLELYNEMLKDISKAKKHIYLETYIYGDEEIGEKFRNALTKAASKGVEVKLLLDAWGSSVRKSFFSELISAGGQVRFFKKIKIKLNFFRYNHNRDHRKLLLIDDKITYIGSANTALKGINWRELTVRIKGSITKKFKLVFLEIFKLHNYYWSEIRSSVLRDKSKNLFQEDLAIIRDIPTYLVANNKDVYMNALKTARKEIIIETAYFVPDMTLRIALKKAAKRGLNVTLILPWHSDVKIVDILREKFLGRLYKKGVKIKYYKSGILHAKNFICDNEIAMITSSNLDFRSFFHQYEIGISSTNPDFVLGVKKHLDESLLGCMDFDYNKWKNRHFFQKVMELILWPFKQWI